MYKSHVNVSIRLFHGHIAETKKESLFHGHIAETKKESLFHGHIAETKKESPVPFISLIVH